MNESRPTKQWRELVSDFQAGLTGQRKCHSVSDVCDFLLRQFAQPDRSTALEYLRDYREVSREHLRFHSKWKELPNMANIADHDDKEIVLVTELIDVIGD
jgi:hypothetical protein